MEYSPGVDVRIEKKTIEVIVRGHLGTAQLRLLGARYLLYAATRSTSKAQEIIRRLPLVCHVLHIPTYRSRNCLGLLFQQSVDVDSAWVPGRRCSSSAQTFRRENHEALDICLCPPAPSATTEHHLVARRYDRIRRRGQWPHLYIHYHATRDTASDGALLLKDM